MLCDEIKSDAEYAITASPAAASAESIKFTECDCAIFVTECAPTGPATTSMTVPENLRNVLLTAICPKLKVHPVFVSFTMGAPLNSSLTNRSIEPH